MQNTDCAIKEASFARLKKLYPLVKISELPLAWSSKDKANVITLSENNLKVHYKGSGKIQKDAASVRTAIPIPASCLLYYYEVRVISKGRDGYIGVGLAASTVNVARLPGWDKHSYGYHGDDGQIFSSSGSGCVYGPTFTTNDVIGCAYNLVDNTCFYTKNGFSLGIAFKDIPNLDFFPTVGLQTSSEELEANFGMEPFVYDIEGDIQAVREKVTSCVINYPVRYTEWQAIINKLVQSWLVHNGYCSSAEVFSKASKQEFKVNVQNVRQRLRIQQLVLDGRVGEAIALTNRLYPDVLPDNPNLLFALKCRQFIEMINGIESGYEGHGSSFSNGDCNGSSKLNLDVNSSASDIAAKSGDGILHYEGNGMEVDELQDGNGVLDGTIETNGTSSSLSSINASLLASGSIMSNDQARLPQILAFGKELHTFSQQLKQRFGSNENNKRMLEDAFSLLAYSDPHNSPVGRQLRPSEREVVCLQLNNAIVLKEFDGCCPKPPLETIIRHTKDLLRLNGKFGSWILDNI